MYKYISLLLFLILVYGQSANALILDEAFYDNGKIKHLRFYKDGIADVIEDRLDDVEDWAEDKIDDVKEAAKKITRKKPGRKAKK